MDKCLCYKPKKKAPRYYAKKFFTSTITGQYLFGQSEKFCRTSLANQKEVRHCSTYDIVRSSWKETLFCWFFLKTLSTITGKSTIEWFATNCVTGYSRPVSECEAVFLRTAGYGKMLLGPWEFFFFLFSFFCWNTSSGHWKKKQMPPCGLVSLFLFILLLPILRKYSGCKNQGVGSL